MIIEGIVVGLEVGKTSLAPLVSEAGYSKPIGGKITKEWGDRCKIEIEKIKTKAMINISGITSAADMSFMIEALIQDFQKAKLIDV